MKKLLIIPLLLVLVSCSSKKHVTIDQERQDESSRIVYRVDSVLVKSYDTLWYEICKSESIYVYVREYDTSAPADSAGNYPLKKETTISIGSSTDTKSGSGSTTETEAVSHVQDSTHVESSERLAVDESKEQDFVGAKIFFLFLFAVIIACIVKYLRDRLR